LKQIFGGTGERRLAPEVSKQGGPHFTIEPLQLLEFVVHRSVFASACRVVSILYVERAGM
jgi:hypothetical protein